MAKPQTRNGPLHGRVALVTGSTLGLGEAIARRLVADGISGIVVTGRNTERGEAVRREIESTGVHAEFFAADLADIDAVGRLISHTDESFGRIDILVNAAGLSSRGSIIDATPELFDTLMHVNARAPFFLMQGAVKIMRREGIAGSIINIGSVAAYGSLPVLAPYSASKSALMAITKNAGFALGFDRIRVNQLNIGWMDTPTEDVIQRNVHGQPADWLQRAEAGMPFGRLLKPSEVAAAVAWLAGDDSGMLTGTVIDFDQSVIGGGDAPVIRREDVPS